MTKLKKNNTLNLFIRKQTNLKKSIISRNSIFEVKVCTFNYFFSFINDFLYELLTIVAFFFKKIIHPNKKNQSTQVYVSFASLGLKKCFGQQKLTSLILFISATLLFSCSQKTVGEIPEKIERKKTSELVSVLDSLSLQKPTTFYSKISTKYRDTTQNISFKTSVRMVKDSALSALITYASIPIYNSILTPDSLTILNKRSKCFTKTKLNYIKDNFGIAFDYKNVEELLLGMPLAYDIDQKYFQIHDQNNYIVSSHRKREIKRSDKKEKLQDDIIIKYYLSNDLKSLNKLEIESKSDTARIQVNFISRQMVDNYNVPNEVFIKVFTPRNEIQVEMNYDKVEINVTQQLFLVIPEGYEVCE